MDHLYADNGDIEMLPEWVERDFDPSIGAQIEVGNEGQADHFNDLLILPTTRRAIPNDFTISPLRRASNSNGSNLQLENLSDVYFDGSEFEVPLVLENNNFQFQQLSGEVQEVDAENLQDQQFIFASSEPNFRVQSTSTPIVLTSEGRLLQDRHGQDLYRVMTLSDWGDNLTSSPFKSVQQIEEEAKAKHSHFTRKWKSLQIKAETLNYRTRANINLKAVFENKTFVWRKVAQIPRTESDQTSSEAEDDHRYAAVIVTQKESSPSVRDHQYNETSFEPIGDTVTKKKPRFIKEQSRRDKQFFIFLLDLFSKKKALEELTGASITLEVTYEGETYTERNYQTADDLLRKKRSSRRVSIVPTVELSNNNQEIASSLQDNSRIIYSVNRTPVRQGESAKIQLFFINKNRNQDDPSNFQIRRRTTTTTRSKESTEALPIIQNVVNENFEIVEPDQDSNISTETVNSEITSVSGPPSVSASMIMAPHSPQEALMDDESSCTTAHATVTGVCLNLSNKNQRHDAWTTTEPTCQLCHCSSAPLTTGTSQGQDISDKLWIRCFNPLCYYMVHPVCIGFQVHSPQHLNMLPPYFCPEHRTY